MYWFLKYAPSVMALIRWDVTGKDGPLAALLTWVALTNWMRWEMLPHLGDDPMRWAIVDMFWVSWYMAHRLVLDRSHATKILAIFTLALTVYSSVYYLNFDRWMEEAAIRDIWLQVAGVLWAASGLITWLRVPEGPGRLLGATSAGLSVVQVIHSRPDFLVKNCPLIFCVVATVILSSEMLPVITDIRRRIQTN